MAIEFKGQAGLTELTQPLFDKIFKAVEAKCGMKGVVNCRLVSKAWLAALQQYPGTANSSSEADSLRRLRAIMPSVSKLCVSHRHNAHLSSNLVDQFKQLTNIELSASSEYQQAESECIVMDHLSSSLRKVTIRISTLPQRASRTSSQFSAACTIKHTGGCRVRS